MIIYSPPAADAPADQEPLLPSSRTYFHYIKYPEDLPFRVVENFAATSPVEQLAVTLQELAALRKRPAGWNGYDVAAPEPAAIEHAEQWLSSFQRRTVKNAWRKPHVTSSANGEVVLEWWNGGKSLVLYISPNSVEYVKAWGPDLEAEMDEGAVSDETVAELWHWLVA